MRLETYAWLTSIGCPCHDTLIVVRRRWRSVTTSPKFLASSKRSNDGTVTCWWGRIHGSSSCEVGQAKAHPRGLDLSLVELPDFLVLQFDWRTGTTQVSRTAIPNQRISPTSLGVQLDLEICEELHGYILKHVKNCQIYEKAQNSTSAKINKRRQRGSLCVECYYL